MNGFAQKMNNSQKEQSHSLKKSADDLFALQEIAPRF